MDTDSPRRLRRRHRSPAGSAVMGVLIATFGLTLLADNLGWADARHFVRQFWPFILMAAGVALLLIRARARNGGHGRFWGVALVLGGLWAYADQRGWVHVNFWAVFGPTLLVLLGASFVWRAFNHPRPDETPEAYMRSFALMSSNELKPTAKAFQGADISAVMGSVVLNLAGAQMEGDTATIDVFTVMGGIEIFVPRDWNVITKVGTLMAACVDQRKPGALPATKTLVIRGFALMSGIEIKD